MGFERRFWKTARGRTCLHLMTRRYSRGLLEPQGKPGSVVFSPNQHTLAKIRGVIIMGNEER